MPPISNIGDISSGKSFTAGNTLNNNRGGSEQNGDQFSVAGAQKPEQLKVVSEKSSGNPSTTMGQKDLIPLAITTAKNQALAVETVKDIINTDLLSTAKLNGYTELVGELEHLSATLYIPAQDLVREMTDQEKENTMFSGDKFYDLLREIVKDANDDQKEAVGNMLKAINFSQNKNEITTAVSSNLRFLAEYFSPNRSLSDKLSQLAEKWSEPEAHNNFANLRGQTADLMRNLSESLLNDSHTQTLLPIITHNMSKFNTNSAMLREYFGQLLSQIPSYEMRNELSNSFEMLLGKLIKDSSFDNYTISEQKNQVENSNFSTDNQIDDAISSFLTENFSNNEYIVGEGLTEQDFSSYITDLHNGNQSADEVIRELLSSLINDDDLREILNEQLSEISNPNEMVDYLNSFLEAMPESPLKEQLYDVLEEALAKMQEETRIAMDEKSRKEPKKNSSIQALTDFVEKNINHPALKSIDSFNASNLLQSMINAPGVMTPLAHYILPVQVENTRSFGELWVDNDDKSGSSGLSGQTHHHLFLTFDVDNTGRFEIDVYANEDTVKVSLLHPAAYGKNIDQLINKINKIAASTKYTVSDFKTGVLKEPHNLTQIFPKLNERRAGLNVKA